MADPDEVIKQAGRFFSKLGSTIKQTGKQVTGLGRGTVRVELDRTRVAPGDKILGRVMLALDESVDAKRLVVTLRAQQRTVELHRSNGSRVAGSTRTEVYHLDRELDGLRGYTSATIPFELDVPPDALDLRPSAGTNPLADVVRTIASALTPTVGPIEWSVLVKLEIPWGRDLGHHVDIVVAP